VDIDDNRLKVAEKLGATHVINNSDGKAVEKVLALTGNKGVDVAVEAIGTPAGFDICQAIVTAGGHIANIGVHWQAGTVESGQIMVTKYYAHNTSRRYRDNADADENRGIRQNPARATDNTPFPAG
jgi:threonine dehydrogenase-like Zn-dependent dehydrogenase